MSLDSIRSSDRMLDRVATSRDLWPGGTLDFWQGRSAPLPARVFWPSDDEQVLAVLREASRLGVEVVTYGAGSGVCGGSRGRAGSWVVDTKALNRIGPMDEERWTVEVEAGVNGQQLEDWLRQRGFTLGHSPSSISCSTVGGWAAARSAGQFSSRYGVFEDMVLGLTAVAPGPGILRLGADEGDPNGWVPLVLGSEGTLGVITRLRLRVWPKPQTRVLRGYRFSDVTSALEAMRSLMQEELWPSVVRLYDPVDTLIGGKTKPKHARADGAHRGWLQRAASRVEQLPAVRSRTLALPLALPSLLARVADRLATGVLLIVGWEGEPEVVEVLSDAGRTILDGRGEDLGPDPGERWFGSRHAVSYKLAPIFERGGFADTMEVACSWGQVEHLYEAVRMALRPHAVVMAHMSHVYPEGCSIYFSFAGKGERAVYDATWAAALDAALQVGGTVTHHHGVGTLKAGAVTREVGAAIRGWEQAKAIFDPANVLNRGVVYTTSPDEAACAPPAGPLAPPGPRDGLVRLEGGLNAEGRADGASASGMELMWPWESLPAPARWHRLPWQIPATAVEGTVEGIEVQLGRAPRSAAGPDLRRWLFAQGAVRHVHMAAVALGPRWMGSSSPPRPWRAAFDLLRADLRPSVLTVQDGRLIVGFRGVAAAALGSLASRYVPGGLDEVAWQQPTLPSGELMACDIDRPDVVAVLPQGALRRRSDVS